jgi:hypothetical protein
LKPRFSKREMMGPMRPRWCWSASCADELPRHHRCQPASTYLDAIRLDSNEAVPVLATPPIAAVRWHRIGSNVRLLGRHGVEMLSFDVVS